MQAGRFYWPGRIQEKLPADCHLLTNAAKAELQSLEILT